MDSKRNWFTDAVILAIIPCSGYAAAYAYEAGFIGHFSGPTELASISILEIFRMLGAMISVTFFLFCLTNLVFLSAPDLNPNYTRAFLGLLPTILLIIGIAFLRWEKFSEYLHLIFIFTFLTFISFGLPLITQRKILGYENKLAAQNEFDSKQISLFCLAVRKFGSLPTLLSICFLVFMFLCREKGLSDAEKQERFWVFESKPNAAVIRMYSNRWICASFDGNKKQLAGRFWILAPSQNPEKIKLEKIGPLRGRKFD